MRVVHYLNQFFGGLGGEDKAGAPLEVRAGAVGPGLLLEQLLGNDAKVVMTLVCGDNYAVEKQEAMIDAALDQIREAKPDLFVAGPCFQAGRYGMAAGALCCAVQKTSRFPLSRDGRRKPRCRSISGKTLHRRLRHECGPNARRPRQDGKLGDEVGEQSEDRTAGGRRLSDARLDTGSIR